MKDRLHVLVDMTTALWERAGIPQVARQMAWMFSQAPDLDLSALLLSIHYRSKASRFRGKKLSSAAIAEDAEYLSDVLGGPARFQFDPLLTGSNLLRRLSGAGFPLIPIKSAHFDEVVWENFFAPGLPAPCREFLSRVSFYRSPLTRREMLARLRGGSRLARLKTDAFDVAIFQNPTAARVSGRTVKIVRFHDLVPLFRFDTQPQEEHLIRDYHKALAQCVEDSYFVCVSEQTRQELLSVHPSIEPRTFVIPNSLVLPLWRANEKREVASASGYFLAVGTVEPRKNYIRLLHAFRILRAKQKVPATLVLVGGKGWRNEEELAELKKAKKEGWLTWYDRVLPDRLIDLYRGAFAFVSSSVHEGFGIPPLEAAAFHTPSVLSDLPIFRAHFADAAEYFDPYDPMSIADALGRMTLERRDRLAVEAAEKAQRFQPKFELEQWQELLVRLVDHRQANASTRKRASRADTPGKPGFPPGRTEEKPVHAGNSNED